MGACNCGRNCGGTACGDSRFTRLDRVDLANTIVESLIPVADDLRDLMTQFGMRAYEVRVVVVGWTGGQRGHGDEYVKRTCVLLPTPKVADLTSLEELVQKIGADEFGSVQITEISARYTEFQLRGFDADGNPPDRDENFFYEIETPTTKHQPGLKRRFVLAKPPNRRQTKLDWIVELERAREDRTRDGRIPA